MRVSLIAALLLLMVRQTSMAARFVDASIFQRIYDANDAAIMHKDVAGSCAMFADSYVLTELHGKRVDLNQWKQNIARNFKTWDRLHSVTHIESVRPSTADAVSITERGVETAVVDGPQRGRHVMHVEGRCVDEWRRVRGQWKMVSTRVLEVETTVDGVLQKD